MGNENKIEKIISLELEKEEINLWEEYHSIENKITPLIEKLHIKYDNIPKDKISLAIERLYEKIEKTCFRYIPKDNEIDIAIVEILKILADDIDNKVYTDTIYEKISMLETNLNTQNLTKRALKTIFCLQMAKHINISNSKKNVYYIDKEEYFNAVWYSIEDIKLLKKLFPLMVAFVKSKNKHSTDDFFVILEDLIRYFLAPIETPSSYIKNSIIEAIKGNKEISLTIKDLSFPNQRISYKNITPTRIILNENKEIEISFLTNNDILTINLKDIIIDEYFEDDYSPLMTFTQARYKIHNETKHLTKQIKIILECSYVVYEYFKKGAFNTQKIFATNQELKELKKLHNIDIKDNYFYIVAYDEFANASAVVLHCLGEVEILEPTNLNNFINEKIKKHNTNILSSLK